MISTTTLIWVAAFAGMCTNVLYDFLLKVNSKKLKLADFDWRYFLTTFVSLVPIAAEVKLFLSNIVSSVVAQGYSAGNAYAAAFVAGYTTEHVVKKKLEKMLWSA